MRRGNGKGKGNVQEGKRGRKKFTNGLGECLHRVKYLISSNGNGKVPSRRHGDK